MINARILRPPLTALLPGWQALVTCVLIAHHLFAAVRTAADDHFAFALGNVATAFIIAECKALWRNHMILLLLHAFNEDNLGLLLLHLHRLVLHHHHLLLLLLGHDLILVHILVLHHRGAGL